MVANQSHHSMWRGGFLSISIIHRSDRNESNFMCDSLLQNSNCLLICNDCSIICFYKSLAS